MLFIVSFFTSEAMLLICTKKKDNDTNQVIILDNMQSYLSNENCQQDTDNTDSVTIESYMQHSTQSSMTNHQTNGINTLFQTPSLLSKTSEVGSSFGNNFTSDDSSLPSICSERNDSKPQSLPLNELYNSNTTMKSCHEFSTIQAISKKHSASHTLKKIRLGG